MEHVDEKVLKMLGDARRFLEKRIRKVPDFLVILGSGLGRFGERVRISDTIDYSEIPHLPRSTVSGHKGRLILGTSGGRQVAVMQGRLHFYEGYPLWAVTFLVRLFAMMKVQRMIVTNAAGGLNKNWRPGDLMLITDHINHMHQNPLGGQHFDVFGQRFPDMSTAYEAGLLRTARASAKELKIKVREGVYMAVTGPSYETPAEVRMARQLGADVIGMSTVPEVIVANQMGVKILGISLVTNMAAGILKQRLDHSEVIETGNRAAMKFESLVEKIIEKAD